MSPLLSIAAALASDQPELAGISEFRLYIAPLSYRNALPLTSRTPGFSNCPPRFDTPTISPPSLIEDASLAGSPGSVRRSLIAPFAHRTACPGAGYGPMRAPPTTTPLLLMSSASPQFPPRLPSDVIAPPLQRTGSCS